MIYAKSITVPANRTKLNPLITPITLTKGLIYRFEGYFPPGSKGLLHFWVMEAGYQVFPAIRGETFWGDNITIAYDDKYFVREDLTEFLIFAYNEDDTFTHSFQVRIGLALKKEFIDSILPYEVFRRLEEAIEEKE